MPGAIPHLIAICALYLIGRHHYKDYFQGDNKNKEKYLLFLVCFIFTFLPDIVLIIYYVLGVDPPDPIFTIHNFVHFILAFMAFVILLDFRNRENIDRKPIWIMGLWSIIVHVIMDVFIPEYGIWF
jgi:hypothetical protein